MQKDEKLSTAAKDAAFYGMPVTMPVKWAVIQPKMAVPLRGSAW